MLTYEAMYKYVDDGVHAELVDFPGVITCGADMNEAREMLAGALVDMAEAVVLAGQALPIPDPTCSDPEADLEEPMHLLFKASSRVEHVPQAASR